VLRSPRLSFLGSSICEVSRHLMAQLEACPQASSMEDAMNAPRSSPFSRTAHKGLSRCQSALVSLPRPPPHRAPRLQSGQLLVKAQWGALVVKIQWPAPVVMMQWGALVVITSPTRLLSRAALHWRWKTPATGSASSKLTLQRSQPPTDRLRFSWNWHQTTLMRWQLLGTSLAGPHVHSFWAPKQTNRHMRLPML